MLAGEPVCILWRLDAFGDCYETEAVTQADDCVNDPQVLRAILMEQERAVDLDAIEGESLQIAKARVAGTEIVKRDADAVLLEEGQD